MNPETRDTFGTEKRVEFKVTLVGYGHSVQEALEDAIESFQNDPGAPDDEGYKVTQE
jgi:hypothetical protein